MSIGRLKPLCLHERMDSGLNMNDNTSTKQEWRTVSLNTA